MSEPLIDGIIRPYSLRITVPAAAERSVAALNKLVAMPRRGWTIASATVEPENLVLVLLLDEEPSIEDQVTAIEHELVALGLPDRTEWNP